MMDNMWPNFMPQYGTTPASRGVNPAFGNAAGKYFLQQSSWPYNTNNKEVTYHLFHHHGDAFIRVCTEVPQTIVATYNPTIFESETEITVTTAASAKICISAYGTILGTASTGMNTTVSITIPQQLVGTVLKVTITKPNCNRYEGYITVVPDVTSANAGEDMTICADQAVQLQGTANNYSSLLWATTGTGTFDDATILNPVYTPSAEDLTSGSVVLSLTASKAGLPDSTDYVSVTFVAVPTVFAGNNANICEGSGYSTSEATAANYTQLTWVTSGTGTFDDVHALVTRYTPSAEDVTAGNIVLTLNASNDICDVQSSSVPIAIHARPVVTISGANTACQNQENVIYNAGSTENTYEWQIIGGTIISGGNTNEVTVNWASNETGNLVLTETNEFGCSETASYDVILNTSPQPSITGEAAVCANSQGVYTTTLVEGNSYEWSVTGGTISQGINANEVTIDWAGNSEGVVSVNETNPVNSCIGHSDYTVVISSPVISLGEDTTLCINHSYTLNVASGYASYAWSTGATTPSIVVTGEEIGAGVTKTYSVTVTDTEGCQSIDTIDILGDACAGLPENKTNSFSLYPNPNTGEFNIQFGDKVTGNITLRVVSATGNVLISRTMEVNQPGQIESFNLSQLSRGVYYVRIESHTGSAVQKLVIK